MSRVAKAPVTLPAGVSVTQTGQVVALKAATKLRVLLLLQKGHTQ